VAAPNSSSRSPDAVSPRPAGRRPSYTPRNARTVGERPSAPGGGSCRFLVHPGPTFSIDRHVIPATAFLSMSHAPTADTFVLSFQRGDPACVSSVGPVFRLATDLVRAVTLGSERTTCREQLAELSDTETSGRGHRRRYCLTTAGDGRRPGRVRIVRMRRLAERRLTGVIDPVRFLS